MTYTLIKRVQIIKGIFKIYKDLLKTYLCYYLYKNKAILLFLLFKKG